MNHYVSAKALDPSGVYKSSSSTYSSTASKEYFDEFIRQLSNDTAYIIDYDVKDVYWTYDKDSDITYVAHYEWNANTFRDNITLRIFEGYKVIDTMCFERLEATSGYIWSEI